MSLSPSEWEELLQAKFEFLSWDIFKVRTGFATRTEIENDGVLIPFDRKKKVVFVSYRKWQTRADRQRSWMYLKDRVPLLSQQFDGFFLWYCCSYNEEGLMRIQDEILSLFIKKCYVFVIDPYEVYKDRFWMLWECLQATKNRRLIVNDNVLPFLESTGPNPTVDTVMELLRAAKATDLAHKERQLTKIRKMYYDGADYSLIPTSEFQKDVWEAIDAIPLSPDQVNPSRVLMVSHRWETKDHPDPQNRKLGIIRDFLLRTENLDRFDYVFFDLVCINQTKEISHSLVKVDELYAKSP